MFRTKMLIVAFRGVLTGEMKIKRMFSIKTIFLCNQNIFGGVYETLLKNIQSQ